MKNTLLFSLACLLLLLASCSGCNKNKSREKPDVSSVNISVELNRFDQDFWQFTTQDYATHRAFMQQKYGEFFDFYVSQFVIGPRPVGDTADVTQDAIRQFLSDRYVRTIQDSINSVYGSTKAIEQELQTTFRYFRYYFPEFQPPQIITINSVYSAGVSPFGKDKLIIGLDLFLGADNKDYDSVGIYQYLRHKMTPAYVARYAVESLYDYYFPEDVNNEFTLAEAIAERGKKIYFLSYVFPDAPDSLLLGYTQRQTDWCTESEKAIWMFFNDKDLLYKNNGMDKTRYLGEGPTTSGMPADAPGNIGNFTGWQMVKKFMKETSGNISLHDLVTRYDGKIIFSKSRYRP